MEMTESSPDVLIVGGGLIGCSTAYFLSLGGAKVTVLEKKGVASGASAGAAGMLGVDSEEEDDPVRRAFARESRDLYESLAPKFRQENGVDIEFEGRGLLTVAQNDPEETALRERAEKGHGEYWAPGKVSEQCPGLACPGRGGLFHPSDGQVTASRAAEAFRRAAEAHGAVIREGCGATGLLRRGNFVEGVKAGKEKMTAGLTVLALGATGWNLMEKGIRRPPVFPVRGELLIFRPARRLLPFPVFLGESGFYLVPKPDGTFLAGTTVKKTGRAVLTNRGRDVLSRAALAALPSLGDAPYLGGWAGLRPGTPDGWPLLGPAPGTQGLWIAGGHFRRGVLLAPATGRWMAEAIQGRPPKGFEKFSPDRFEPGKSGYSPVP
jgi:glycine oxidase